MWVDEETIKPKLWGKKKTHKKNKTYMQNPNHSGGMGKYKDITEDYVIFEQSPLLQLWTSKWTNKKKEFGKEKVSIFYAADKLQHSEWKHTYLLFPIYPGSEVLAGHGWILS